MVIGITGRGLVSFLFCICVTIVVMRLNSNLAGNNSDSDEENKISKSSAVGGPSEVRNNFSKLVEAYKKFRRDYPDQVYELIYAFCDGKDSNVLDIGCGTGIVTNHLAKHYQKIIGIDKEREMVEAAQLEAGDNVEYVIGKVEDISYPDDSFDLVTAAAAYSWLDYDVAGKKIFKLLKNDGKLVVFYKSGKGITKRNIPEFAHLNFKKYFSGKAESGKEPITADIFYRVGFTKVQFKELDLTEWYTKDEILGFITSHSTFNLLSDEQKEKYMEENERSVSECLIEGMFRFDYKVLMYLVEK